MLYLYLTILVIFNTFALMLVPFALPGNWLMVTATTLFAWWQWDRHPFSIATLIAILILALLGELFEFLGGFGGARKKGAGFLGSIGAILGAIAGAFFGTFLIPIPILGTLAGSCIGAGLAAAFFEIISGRELNLSLSRGFGASVGQFIGTMAKFAAGSIIWLTITIAAII